MNTTRKLFTGFFFTAVTAATVSFAVMGQTAYAQENETPVEHGPQFIDADGDGYNDAAPDVDGDGVPNGQDSDYTRPGNGTGKGNVRGFVDEDGDGFNDNAPDADGDGIPNGQDGDYAPEGKSNRNKGANRQNGNGVKNGIHSAEKGSGHRYGKAMSAESSVKGSNTAGSLREKSSGMGHSRGGGGMHGGK